jgi:hypothetical protein
MLFVVDVVSNQTSVSDGSYRVKRVSDISLGLLKYSAVSVQLIVLSRFEQFVV